MSKRAQTTITLQVRVQVPEGSSTAEVLHYIRVAIGSYGGGLSPDNPFFAWGKDDSITIKLVKKETTYA